MSKMFTLTLLAIVLSAVLYDTVSGCTTCSTSETLSCEAFNSYINCLKGITVANNCSDVEVTHATDSLSKLNLFQCSGTTTATTSIVLMAALPLLTYIL